MDLETRRHAYTNIFDFHPCTNRVSIPYGEHEETEDDEERVEENGDKKGVI